MSMKLADRIAHVTSELQKLGFQNIILTTYRPGPTNLDGYYKLQAIKYNYRVFIAELLIQGSIVKYSYTLLHGENAILRYDNAPHYPHIETFPHHKHENDRIKPLYNHSIESFIKEVKILLEKG
ncbi:MAG: DUF6516 family protein [Desulfurococcales archaeon]|nr:DUF6516 family protein [Desulfurococcales archaeon]